MQLIPAIDLRGGRVVRLQQGDYACETHHLIRVDSKRSNTKCAKEGTKVAKGKSNKSSSINFQHDLTSRLYGSRPFFVPFVPSFVFFVLRLETPETRLCN